MVDRKMREEMQQELEKEKDNMKRRETDVLNNLQKEFENEKQLRKERFAMQLSKYMKSGQSLDQLDENEEKRELEVVIYFHFNTLIWLPFGLFR